MEKRVYAIRLLFSISQIVVGPIVTATPWLLQVRVRVPASSQHRVKVFVLYRATPTPVKNPWVGQPLVVVTVVDVMGSLIGSLIFDRNY